MTVHDPNNPHPAYSTEWVEANRRYEDEIARRTGQHPACFPAETPVLTPGGTRPIERIRAGDEVLALGRRGTLLPRRVCRAVAVAATPLLAIHWASRRAPLLAMAHHAFGCRRGWVRCGSLRRGDLARRVDGGARSSWDEVARTEASGGVGAAFNLIVERDLNFIAGGCLVHSFGYARVLRTWCHHLRLAIGLPHAPRDRRSASSLRPSIESR